MRHTLTACVWLAVLCGLFTARPATAQSLETLLESVIQSDHRVIGAEADVAAARERAREALGDWFPLLEPTVNHGYELTQNPHGSDTGLPFSEVDLSLTQKLWDFGTTNALVEKARLELVEKQLTLAKVKEDLILEAINAYVNLFKVFHSLAFAQQSKDNVQKQTGLEEAKVESGSGLSTDVLQAKSQLAGAIAREIQSEGALLAARNRYRAVFGKPPVPEKMLPVALPLDRLSRTLEESIEKALDNNTQIAIDSIGEAIARQDQQNVYSDNFFPKLEGVITQKWKNNVSGTVDLKKETLAKVEMTMPINLGFIASNTLRAAESDVISKSRVVANTRRDIEEQVRNAWQELNTAKLTARSLQNQSDISAAFLELARQERKLGQRSLIDVLSGETSLLNSQSDSISAETDVIIAAFKLLNVTGELKENFVRGATLSSGTGLPLPADRPNQPEKLTSAPDPAPLDKWQDRQLLAKEQALLTIDTASAGVSVTAVPAAVAETPEVVSQTPEAAPEAPDAGFSPQARKPFEVFADGVQEIFRKGFLNQEHNKAPGR
ncbi:MAG: TolC family protein [Rhodospirillales bacterium]|nr:TolC family protein [Rhodospirillales bacterium]